MKHASWTRQGPSKKWTHSSLHFTNMLTLDVPGVCDMRDGLLCVLLTQQPSLNKRLYQRTEWGPCFISSFIKTRHVYPFQDIWTCHLDKLRLLRTEIHDHLFHLQKLSAFWWSWKVTGLTFTTVVFHSSWASLHHHLRQTGFMRLVLIFELRIVVCSVVDKLWKCFYCNLTFNICVCAAVLLFTDTESSGRNAWLNNWSGFTLSLNL